MRRRKIRTIVTVVAGIAALAAVLSACTTGTKSDAGAPTSSAPATTAASTGSAAPQTSSPAASDSTPATPSEPDAVVTVAPSSGQQISPKTPITVSVADGTIDDVQLVNDAGKAVTGQASADGSSWTSTEPLGYGRTYNLKATVRDASGKKTVKKASYTTLTPPNQTMPYFQYTGGYTLNNGATYGVGIVPVVHWDEAITDRNAALDTISITTTPHVAGAWYWADSQDVAFRPQTWWPSGTKVTITVQDYGVAVSPGLYGQADATISFTIGAKQITVATDNAPVSVNTVVVYRNDKQIKSFHTSMGQHSSVTYAGKVISFYTMSGTYTVLEHDNPAVMSSESYGLPANAPGGYGPENIYYATKISTDGIYLHELTTTIWAQENGQDVSHGCLNLSTANATWFYSHSQVGDPVVIRGTKGAPEITYWQGGAWSVPWKTWVAGGRAVS